MKKTPVYSGDEKIKIRIVEQCDCLLCKVDRIQARRLAYQLKEEIEKEALL